MTVLNLTNSTFSKVIGKHSLVVVDFWAKWCGPCKSFSKVVEGLTSKYPDVIFGSIDIEQEKELAQDFNIISVPAVMVLKNQVVVYADSGTMSASSLSELIEKAKKLNITSD